MPNQDRSGHVRVATLNLWGRQGNWQDRREVLIAGFRELGPDLIALQEVIVTADYNQAADILDAALHRAHQQKGLIGDGNSIAIASRWPITRVYELDQHLTPRTADFPCTTMIAEIEEPSPVGTFLFVNHFPSYQLDFEYERELQTVAVARVVNEWVARRPMHVVVAGDLDADPGAASIRFWSGRQSLGGVSVCYRDAWESAHPGEPGHTFTPENALMAMRKNDWPFRRIDHIFVRCDNQSAGPTLHIQSCERIFDEPKNGVWASDHFGVMADLVVPDA